MYPVFFFYPSPFEFRWPKMKRSRLSAMALLRTMPSMKKTRNTADFIASYSSASPNAPINRENKSNGVNLHLKSDNREWEQISRKIENWMNGGGGGEDSSFVDWIRIKLMRNSDWSHKKNKKKPSKRLRRVTHVRMPESHNRKDACVYILYMSG